MKKILILITIMMAFGQLNAQRIRGTNYHKFKTKQGYETGYLLNHVRNGKWTAYDAFGHKLWEKMFVFGVMEGFYVSFSPINQIQLEGVYKDGQRHGEWIYYNHITGFVDSILLFRSGILISKL